MGADAAEPAAALSVSRLRREPSGAPTPAAAAAVTVSLPDGVETGDTNRHTPSPGRSVWMGGISVG